MGTMDPVMLWVLTMIGNGSLERRSLFLVYIYHFAAYSDGDSPVAALKYLEK